MQPNINMLFRILESLPENLTWQIEGFYFYAGEQSDMKLEGTKKDLD